ncbi:ribbon-helix-helix protein, CopG family [Burkholderia gladioli]|nr:ribbon-helix-helix protein, CopG family [Burkholderia gladioli]
MPRQKGSGRGINERFNIRLDAATAARYRELADAAGLPMSEFLRQTLTRGLAQQNVERVVARLDALDAQLPVSSAPPIDDALLDELAVSVFFCRDVLREIVSERNIQTAYKAEDRARAQLKRLRTK